MQRRLQALGQWVRPLVDAEGRVCAFWVEKHSHATSADVLLREPGVQAVLQANAALPEVTRLAGVSLHVDDLRIGGDGPPVLIAGPCAIESEAQIWKAAELVARAGAEILRAGAYKPRTSPYSFAGHGATGLGWASAAARHFGLGICAEVLSEAEVERVAELASLVQIGARNAQNFALLRRVGATGRHVLLKRGMASRLGDWLAAGEHLMAAGCPGVIFCERGVVGFDESTRGLLDLGTVALLRHVHRVPTAVDPSHALGRADLIPHLSMAALAAGAHVLMVEFHPDPAEALSDGAQSISYEQLCFIAEAMSATSEPRKSGDNHGRRCY